MNFVVTERRLNLMHSFHGLFLSLTEREWGGMEKGIQCNKKKHDPQIDGEKIGTNSIIHFKLLLCFNLICYCSLALHGCCFYCYLFNSTIAVEHWKMAFQPPLIITIWMLNGVIKATNENITHKWCKSKRKQLKSPFGRTYILVSNTHCVIIRVLM